MTDPAAVWRAEFARSLRLPLGFAFGVLYLAFARPTWLTLIVGGGIALIGVIMRGWASGHIRKNERLAVGGPYAHTRNPLYLGSFLIAAGFAVAAHWGLLLIVIAFFAAVYGPTMQRERANISGRFPEAFKDYEANVPAFFPRAFPWRPENAGARGDDSFSWALYMKHGEWKAGLTFAIVMLWLAYRARAAL